MAKNDQQEAYEKHLTATLARVIDFVKFAEAKNAALLTFSSAWTLATVNILNKFDVTPPIWIWCGGIALFFFVSSAILSIRTFLPKKLEHIFKDPDGDRSLVYFNHIALYETTKYCQLIRDAYYPPDANTTTERYLNDLSVQISVNSKVASRKFSLFNYGAALAGAGVLALVFPLTAPTVKAIWHWAVG